MLSLGRLCRKLDVSRAAHVITFRASQFNGKTLSLRRAASVTGASHSSRRVDQLPVPEAVKQNLHSMGLTKLFEIQSKAFEPILRGKSFVGRSRTGSGKTVAYLLPLLERMRHEKMTAAHSLLILVPTRELCKQVASALLSLSVQSDVALVYGGASLDSQEQLVRLGASIVVATPGRCARLVERGALEMQNVRALVIDEADAMLGAEYVGRVERVLSAAGKRGLQLVLFSASLPPEVLTIVSRHFPDHEFIDLVDRSHGPKGVAVVQSVEHRLCKVQSSRVAARARVLLHLLNSRLDMESRGRCIIFVDTAAEARALLSHPALDRRARALHGHSTSQDRDATINAFANREFDVLIATDIVARGVDFAEVSLVLQLHPPRDATQYIHRAGRTGRAGLAGACITLYDPSEHKYVQRVREVVKHKFLMEPTPGPLDIHHAAVSRLLEQLLTVQEEEYEALIDDASQLLEEQGPGVLATAMAVLDSRHVELARASREQPSLLSGKKGYVCLLAHDPEHMVATTEGEVKRILETLLPKQANELSIGRVVRVVGGWAVDVSLSYAPALVEDLRAGRRTSPFEVSAARRVPRVLRSKSRRTQAGAAPWAAQRKRAFVRLKGRQRTGEARADGRWPGQVP